MNFNYSYKAFLISCLLVGNLVLLLVSVKLSSEEKPEQKVIPVEYAMDVLEDEEEEELAANMTETVKVETNTAYNEAEKFITELENSRNSEEEISEELATETQSEEQAAPQSDYALNNAKEQLKSVKERLAENARKNKEKASNGAANTKTTISYHLVDRSALKLRNPVYTCNSGGKVVINIEVNRIGKVVKTSFNKAASTTTNGCLVESAIKYATQAKFTTKADKSKQIGTITYTFPGQL